MIDLDIAAQLAWQFAAREAAVSNHGAIEPAHLVCGVCSLAKAVTMPLADELREAERRELRLQSETLDRILMKRGTDQAAIRRALRAAMGRGEGGIDGNTIHRSAATKAAFTRALHLAGGRAKVTGLHLLAAALMAPSRQMSEALGRVGVKGELLLENVRSLMETPASGETDQPGATPTLDEFGRDLTKLASEGKLGPIIGRRKELLSLIQTLARRKKNNPMLIGEPGVGKTAVVEALAIRAAAGKNADILGGKRIIELGMGGLIAGTSHRGDFEKRIQGILEEARANDNVIVFIDEIHTMVGAGGGGASDAANLLKPALARGEFTCIGATTIDEYRKYIEEDPALARRFETIVIGEPSREEAIAMLRGLKAKWEAHHWVTVEDAAIEAAVDLSVRFDTDHRLPDKAIDLIDKAGARARVPVLTAMEPGGAMAAPAATKTGRAVTARTIAGVLADKVNIPVEIIVGSVDGDRGSRLLAMAEFVKKHLVGQDHVVDAVVNRLMMSQAGLRQRKRPLAVYLFLGPTGVGKTELARLVASFLFNSESEMIRLDMSEYMEQHSVAKLIGSPPGYIGSDDEGQFTGKLRTKPYSVVLLDEVEKAHARVFDMFLQVFDEGRISDSKGRTIDAANCIFIMTSNLGVSTPQARSIGFEAEGAAEVGHDALIESLKQFFRPEFLNRIDEILMFRPLGAEAIAKIVTPLLGELCRNLHKRYGVILEVGSDATALLAEAGHNPEFGARHLKRTVERMFEMPLSALILSGELKKYFHWRAHAEAGLIVFRPVA